jgi:RNA polymerase sigma-70 factor (ECF subfamily)
MTDAHELPNSRPVSGREAASSATLLNLAKEGDASAWRQIEFLYRPLVRWWCRRSGLRSPQDIEDVVQNVFQAVAKQIAGFTKGPKGSFRAWLHGITRHKLADQYRRANREPKPVGGSEARLRMEELPADASDSSSAEGNISERTILIRRALELVRPEFKSRTWEAAWRVVVEERSPGDVAAEFGMTVGAVHTAKSRVLGRLREVLEDLQL